MAHSGIRRVARLLFVGDLWRGSNATSMARGFAQLGHRVLAVDTSPVSAPSLGGPEWLYRKVVGSPLPLRRTRVEQSVTNAANELRPDILVCFKTVHLNQEILLSLPGQPVTVHYSPDDVSNPYNTTQRYLDHESRWNLIVTTKRHNINELRARGVQNVLFVWSAFDPAWHHRTYCTTQRKRTIGFIGNYRSDRLEILRRLGNNHPGRVVIYGPNWRRKLPCGMRGVRLAGPVYGEDFATAVQSIAANLVLLNSDNRDQHTCRSLEVPACGGLFVGERTDEHRELLDEGKEALFFGSYGELHSILERVTRYPRWAADIAEAGHQRIFGGRHTYRDRAEEIVGALG
jgi:Glycosyl transferases group 1